MAFTDLHDGGLSVKIAGFERFSSVHALEWESTNLGDGAASFWMEPANPLNPQATFPELYHGATVVVQHTMYNAGVNSPLTTTWEDVSVNGNDGTLTGFAGTTNSGWAGTGASGDPYRLVFDGTDSVNGAVAGITGAPDYSFEMWGQVTSAGAYASIVFHTDYGTRGWVCYDADAGGGLLLAFFKADGGWAATPTVNSVFAGTDLVHFAFVIDNTALTFTPYKNGVAGAPTALSEAAVLPNDTSPLKLMSTAAGYSAAFRVYPFALTPAQVAQNYAAGPQASSAIHGSGVVPGSVMELVAHDAVATTTNLYKGFVLSDPRAGCAGEKSVVTVECGGVLDVAKNRTDLGFIFTDTDESQWFANRRNPKCYSVDNSDRIDIRVADDTKVPFDKAGICGYVPYLGAEHLLRVNGGPMTGVKRIKGTISYDLHDNMRGALVWAPSYKSSLDVTDGPNGYTIIHEWGTNTSIKNHPINYASDKNGNAIGGANGAGYIALALWGGKSGIKTKAERYLQLEYAITYTGTSEKTIDEAMHSVANVVGLHGSVDTATIGGAMPSLLSRPCVDPAAALADFALQADVLVDWGYHRGVFRARPLKTNPTTIRALPNCYALNPTLPEVVWDVTQHPEDFIARAVRLIYGRLGKSSYPAGTPAQVISHNPGWSTGKAFRGGSSPVLTVDWSHKNFSTEKARTLAKRLAMHLGVGGSSGSVSLTGKTVPVASGGTVPVPYIHGGDWVEGVGTAAGPLLVTRAHVVADTGFVDMDVGIADGTLLKQLIDVGAAGHPRKRATVDRWMG